MRVFIFISFLQLNTEGCFKLSALSTQRQAWGKQASNAKLDVPRLPRKIQFLCSPHTCLALQDIVDIQYVDGPILLSCLQTIW